MVNCASVTYDHVRIASYKTTSVAAEHQTRSECSISTASSNFSSVSGLDEGSMQALQRLYTGGVKAGSKLWRLTYAGEVPNDGNCLFTSLAVSLGMPSASGAAELRRRAVDRFLSDYRALADEQQRAAADEQVRNLYWPDLSRGWGVHFVQQRKMLLRASDEPRAAAAIAELVGSAGMDAAAAAESVYGDLALPVDCCARWALYMGSTVGGGGCGSSSSTGVDTADSSIASAAEAASAVLAAAAAAMETEEQGAENFQQQQQQQREEYAVVNLQYVEEGLLSAEVQSGSATFGDDLAIDALAQALGRDIYVVQSHAQDAVDASTDGGLFFLPHPVRSDDAAARAAADAALPAFLLMKGSDWTAVGGDHYDPLLTSKAPEGVAPSAKPYDLV